MPPQHIVAAGALVTHSHGSVLMVYSPRRGWEFPGGQIEQGETVTDGLLREIHEETGVTAQIGALVGVYSNVQRSILMFGFLAGYVSGNLTTSPETSQVEWVARDQALALVTQPAIRDRLRDMLNFDGRVIYRAYRVTPDAPTDYTIVDERWWA